MTFSRPQKYVPSFESLRVWHDARHLTKDVYRATRAGGFASDFAFRNQVRRAALSVMSNIAEGHERGGRKEFRRFLMIAKGSAGEVCSQLYAAEDIGLLDRVTALRLRQGARTLSRRIAALAATLQPQGRTSSSEAVVK